MKSITRTIQLFNLLSIDVVLGSMAGMYFFSEILESSCPFSSYLILGMAVWGIYTLDHLADAKMAKKKTTSPRHQFHQDNFYLLLSAWLIIFITGILVLILSQEIQFVIIPGIFLAFVMILWMGSLKWMGEKFSWLKEISTALFYVSGITLVPWLLKGPDYDQQVFFMLVSGYLILAFLNLLILSYFDHKGDEKDGFGSILVLISKVRLSGLIWFLGIFGVIFLISFLFWQPSYFRIHFSLLLLMLLFHLIQFASWNNEEELARQKMEAIFILPVVLLLI